MKSHDPVWDDFEGRLRRRREFSWPGLVLAYAVLGLLVGMILRANWTPRTGDRRLQCASNLRQVGLALSGYHQLHGCFPPPEVADSSGKPIHAWRTLLLPFLDYQDLFDGYKFDEPWDGPNNGKLAALRIGVLRCPIASYAEHGLTNYVLIRGPGTAFPGGGRRVTLADVRDDPSTTILAVESVDSGIHWAEPRDLDIGRMSFRINDPSRPGLSSHHPGRVNVLMMDGSVRFLRDDLSPATVRALITIDGGEVIDGDDLGP